MILEKNSQNYWEKLLENEGLWDIDKKLWIKNIWKTNIKNTSDYTKNDVEKILNSSNFEKYFYKNFPNLELNVDYQNWEINIYDKKTKILIWHIGSWKNILPWYEREEHLYFEVDEKYSWKWIWKFLYEYYVLLSKKYKNFVVPKEDYISSPSMLNFYLKNEIFSLVSEYNFESKNFEELSFSEIEKLKKENTEKYYDKNGNRRFFKLSN